MLQQAISVTRDNVSAIADSLIDYTAQDILEEAEYFFGAHMAPVLVRDVLDGVAVMSYIVSESMFHANSKTSAPLNDQTFVDVVRP